MGDRERAFVEGKGTFVEDMLLPETLHLRIVRSPYARARLLRVRGGITHADLNATVTSVGEGAAEGGSIAYPVLASDVVNFVGQPVAAVLGEDRYRAADVQVAGVAVPPIHPGLTSNLRGRAPRPGRDPVGPARAPR